jgi:hypothetical protein
MSKYFRFLKKKYLNNFRIFSYMQEKNKYSNFIFLFFARQKLNFLCNKTTKNRLKECFSNTPLNLKTLQKNYGKLNRV